MRASRRAAKAPLFRLEVRVTPDAAEVAGVVLVEEGAGGAVHDERPHEVRLGCYGEDRGALAGIAERVRRRLATLGIQGKTHLGPAPRALQGWATAWMRDLEAVRVSDTLSIVPTTAKDPGLHGVRVLLEPAMAFGFGEHPTTRMAAREVEARCRTGAKTVLDFGTGSGVLAIAAALSGATRVVGLDSDAAAVAAARGNAERNGVLGRCRFSGARLGRLRASFDVVVANVDRATLLACAVELAARVAPGGVLLVTGFLRQDAREIGRCYRALGLAAQRRREEEGWVLLRFCREATSGRAVTAGRGSRTTAARRSAG